nr:MAG TPA: hypothetical protein [Caudoviricetes sp.]
MNDIQVFFRFSSKRVDFHSTQCYYVGSGI